MRNAKRLVLVVATFGFVIGTAACSDSDSAATTTVQAGLNPALPNDINPIPYTMNMLAGMGNVQIVVTGITGNAYSTESAPEREIEVRLTFRNGALKPVKIQKESFRVYTSDLNSVTPTNDPFTAAIPANTKMDLALSFHLSKGLLAVGLVFDSDGYGDRVISGQFILNPDYKGIDSADS